MKKYPFLWMLALVVLFNIYPENNKKFSLTGTVWQQVKNEETIYTLAFGEGICFYKVFDRKTHITVNAAYTYSLHYPTILFTSKASGHPCLTGHISGKTISLAEKHTKKVIVVLTPQ